MVALATGLSGQGDSSRTTGHCGPARATPLMPDPPLGVAVGASVGVSAGAVTEGTGVPVSSMREGDGAVPVEASIVRETIADGALLVGVDPLSAQATRPRDKRMTRAIGVRIATSMTVQTSLRFPRRRGSAPAGLEGVAGVISHYVASLQGTASPHLCLYSRF
jgi:hypothetical protein